MQTNFAIRPKLGQIYVCKDGVGFEPGDIGDAVAAVSLIIKDTLFRIGDVADTSKRWGVDVSAGQTTGTTVTLATGNQTANRTFTLPVTSGASTLIVSDTASGNQTVNGSIFSFNATIAANQSIVASTIIGSSALVVNQATGAGGGPVEAFYLSAGGSTNSVLSTEVPYVKFQFSAGGATEWATGAIATQRAFIIAAPTYAFVSDSTITNTATVAIVGAPIAGANARFTNSYALWIQSGKTALAPATATGATVNLPPSIVPGPDVRLDGDLWTVNGSGPGAGIFQQINGQTQQVMTSQTTPRRAQPSFQM